MEPTLNTTVNTDILVDLAAMMATLESLDGGALFLIGTLGFSAIWATVYGLGKLLDRFIPSKLLQEDKKTTSPLYTEMVMGIKVS